MKALVFPGQGSQAVGMGRALYDAFPVAREVFQEVDEALGQKLSAICFEGPEDALTATENTQPAIMACGIAALRVLEREAGFDVKTMRCVAGHSLGEYTALCAAGSLSLADTAKLLRIRGSAMQAAVPAGKGAMAAILGPDIAVVREIVAAAAAQTGGTVEVANHNGAAQIVISGEAAAVDVAMTIAKDKGAKRAVLLAVSAPFHSSLMQPAAAAMREALAAAKVTAPVVPVIANVTADAVSNPDDIRRLLVEQVTGMVRWVESVERMAALGVTSAIELGHGNVLAGLMKRIVPDMVVTSVGAPADLDTYSKAA
ncbi:MAG: [acyl-carrier-protein] S-malonyltransferase [Alphaproteobacteria bacterium]|nr:[acyl-carrier-protein] S-malonyltransferase [Alphaproteobacteria bacterium]